jgi:N-acetylglucosaminyldiphosphoundecaprenol N-acetyl-beta-D-mannosaminyltransferase
MQAAVARMADWIEAGKRHYVCVTGVHGVMESQDDEELRDIHNRAGLTTPDGMPMVWSAHYAGAPYVARVYGPDLMLEMSREAAQRGWRFFFYGGKEGVAERLASRLEAQFPGLQVVGCFSPPFRALSSEEDAAIIERINSLDCSVVWVGLSTPKQERWMADHLHRVNAAVMVGVGAAFDIHAGMVRQAPPWMQRSGLEWLFRLMQEPGRLWTRYLYNNPRFIVRVVRRRPTLVPETADPGV